MSDEYIDELRIDHLGLVGGSSAMSALRDLIRRVAASDGAVLIVGPAGAGKSLVAEAIHHARHDDNSAGSAGAAGAAGAGVGVTSAVGAAVTPTARLARIRCSEIGEEGIEQVLFGLSGQAGLLGERGTLVLDDVDELSMHLQGKLMHALHSGTYHPRGTVANHPVMVRVIAITARSLARRVREGTFRADLLYEMGALTVSVPGLDERRDDIPALVNHFLRLGPRNVRFSGEALDLMATRSWPGSVRELRNLVERVAAFAREPVIGRDALQVLLVPPAHADESVTSSLNAIIARLLELPVANKLAAIEAAMLETAMRASSGNKSAAARLLGVHRKAVERKLEKHRVRGFEKRPVNDDTNGQALPPSAQPGDSRGQTGEIGIRKASGWHQISS